MTLSSSDLCAQLLRNLAEPAFRALALAALAGLALALGRAKDAAVRLAVWTTVLYASLFMPFLSRIAPNVRLPLPALLSAHFALAPAPGALRTAAAGSPLRASPPNRAGAALAAARPAAQSLRMAVRGQPQGLPLHRALSWPLVVVSLYLLVTGVLLGQLLVGFYFGRQVKHLSSPIGDRRVRAILLAQSARWSLPSAPRVAESAAVAVPVTLGAWYPLILLPAAWRAWSEEKMQAVLAHELSHVARKDALTRVLAAIHRSVFWFSPLAWWLELHLATLAEQASDDAALGTGTDRVFYANLLLGFYHDLKSAVRRVRWEGVAMTHGKQARERVERILDSSRKLSAGLRKPSWAALALLAVPVLYVLAGARPVVAEKPDSQEIRASAAAAPSPAAAPQGAALQPPTAVAQAPSAPAAPKPAPAAPSAPKAPTPPSEMWGTWTPGEPGEEVILSCGDTFVGSGSFNSSSDWDHVKALRSASKSDFIWFRRNGKAYVIRDPATVERAKGLYGPLPLVEQTERNLEAKQEALNAQQEKLSREMKQVRVGVPDLTAEANKLKAQLDELHKHGATQDQLNDLQTSFADIQRKLGELQGEAGGKLGAIGGEIGDLGGRQAELGDQIRQLAERQSRLAEEGSGKMKTLLEEAIAKGLAKPE